MCVWSKERFACPLIDGEVWISGWPLLGPPKSEDRVSPDAINVVLSYPSSILNAELSPTVYSNQWALCHYSHSLNNKLRWRRVTTNHFHSFQLDDKRLIVTLSTRNQRKNVLPRLRNSFALDFFIVMNRFNVRFDPLSFAALVPSPIPRPLPDDGMGDPIGLFPVDADIWVPGGPCWRALKGAWGRRQPFDQGEGGGGKLFFGVGERTGVLALTLPILIEDCFPLVGNSDEADWKWVKRRWRTRSWERILLLILAVACTALGRADADSVEICSSEVNTVSHTIRDIPQDSEMKWSSIDWPELKEIDQ